MSARLSGFYCLGFFVFFLACDHADHKINTQTHANQGEYSRPYRFFGKTGLVNSIAYIGENSDDGNHLEAHS